MKQAAIKRTLQARVGHEFFMTALAKRLAAVLLAFLTLATLTHSIKSQVAAGNDVSVETQRALGLVTVNGGCSGTLLNQFWVLTARHCVTVGNKIPNDLQSHNRVQITTGWAGKTAVASRIYDFDINSAAGSARDRDIVLVYLGSDNFGETGNQKIFVVYRDGKISGRLRETDTVTQFGIGFSTFAKDPMTPSKGLGTFRSAVFNPSGISATHYNLNMNTGNQSGHGGDSGGPSVVTVSGQPNGGIAGVQSTCKSSGSVPGKPADDWSWATGINFCTYVSTEPFLNEISRVIKDAPLKPPFITAGPMSRLTPSHPASVYLGWDGGPDHPGAEVWISMNGGVETQLFYGVQTQSDVFKLPKVAALELLIPRELTGTTYKFVLKDAGKTLSTVVVVAVP